MVRKLRAEIKVDGQRAARSAELNVAALEDARELGEAREGEERSTRPAEKSHARRARERARGDDPPRVPGGVTGRDACTRRALNLERRSFVKRNGVSATRDSSRRRRARRPASSRISTSHDRPRVCERSQAPADPSDATEKALR